MTWPVLFASMSVATMATTLGLFRTVDLSGPMASVLLLTPTAQAGALAWSAGPRTPWMPLARRVLAHPLTGPVLWVDLVLLPAGWLFAHHPLWGMSVAAILQRRWMATKFVAASAFLVSWAWRSAQSPPRDRSVVIALALALAAIGLDGFAPWIYAVAFRVPPPFSSQPLTFLWLEIYGGAIILVVLLSLRAAACARTRRGRCGVARRGGSRGPLSRDDRPDDERLLQHSARRAVGGSGRDVRVGLRARLFATAAVLAAVHPGPSGAN